MEERYQSKPRSGSGGGARGPQRLEGARVDSKRLGDGHGHGGGRRLTIYGAANKHFATMLSVIYDGANFDASSVTALTVAATEGRDRKCLD